MLNKYSIVVLAASEEADNLADASHIAVASVHELDMIISLNFKHIYTNGSD